MKNVIICGSKKYENINLDKLVDSFDIIVRNNMLLPDNNYGKRNSNYQVLNSHIEHNRIRELSLSGWISNYSDKFGMPENHITRFFEYLKLDSVEFKYFPENNTSLMYSILNRYNIHHSITKQLRCGFGYIAESISFNIKPFLIGYSLDNNYALNKQYCNINGTGECHNIDAEIVLIMKLHEAGLVDASLCAIKDSEDLTIDSSLITPTQTSLDILRKVYK
jgi:hypothetical protein